MIQGPDPFVTSQAFDEYQSFAVAADEIDLAAPAVISGF
jgi:hypothetical protein